jgi:uncharacterized protein YxjI
MGLKPDLKKMEAENDFKRLLMTLRNDEDNHIRYKAAEALIKLGWHPKNTDEKVWYDSAIIRMTSKEGIHPAFLHKEYLFRKKALKLFGGAFHVYDENGKLAFYSNQKAFKLKEDFRVYSDESQTKELLSIKTLHILDVGAIFNVQDTTTGEAVGAIKRKAFKSILKDEWIFISNEGQEIGKLTESSIAIALLSRFISGIPQNYVVLAQGKEVTEIRQHFNPFVLKYSMEIREPHPSIDRRLLISMGILLAGIEGRQ